eukprot:CAMPEP_0177713160 /NCGR_PEP_ID=MMETSP0484_2-20121128/12787_1 /TAXON_ID=354590 /ORGANISM="Rhodomonas lens, Strain RHODO" /LENGTH=222 /DNA_ID=CAMNT_0019225023 /DNA_START=23 /DNA_END=691 /DNA_ORIENTATION=+
MSDIKVHYFGATGRGEQIRLSLALADKPFTNVTPGEDVPGFIAGCREKGGNLTTNLPMLEVDGKFYPQSQAASRYIGRRFKLYGSEQDAEQAFLVDKLMDDADDFRAVGYKCCYLPSFGMLATKEGVDKLLEETIPKHLKNFERQLGSQDYFLGTSPTIADASIYNVLVDFFVSFWPTILADYPNLQQFCDRFAAIPSVKAYLESDQKKKNMSFSADLLPKE